MSLAEKFRTIESSQTGLPCGVAKILESMQKDDKKALNEVLFEELPKGSRVSNTKIYQILIEEGYDIAPSSIAQHRRRQCRCFVGKVARQTKESK